MLAFIWVGTTPTYLSGALQQHDAVFRTGFSFVPAFGLGAIELELSVTDRAAIEAAVPASSAAGER